MWKGTGWVTNILEETIKLREIFQRIFSYIRSEVENRDTLGV